MDAKLHVANTSLGPRALIAQNIIHDAIELMNTDSGIDLIEKNLDPMYVEVKRLEKQLPLTSD
jgi:hypothetical protein